jgi:hypothetical protein
MVVIPRRNSSAHSITDSETSPYGFSTFTLRAAADRPTDLPVGLFGSLPVQPHLQKYFSFRPTQIRCISITVSFRQEGRSRVVTNAGRDAVDARASGAPWQSQGEMNLVSGQLACKMIGA